MRIGLYLDSSTPLPTLLAQVEHAEHAGFAAVWLSNIFAHDALTVLALAGQRSTALELGTAVVPTYPRHPTALAQQALTVQAASGNRLVLGIGPSTAFRKSLPGSRLKRTACIGPAKGLGHTIEVLDKS
jgi:alkanesulfonate monooxygenase SsuD/methylene tetrahydromethanopterin reductase-like flavin-dependent oxidoreductase (luciferase family)